MNPRRGFTAGMRHPEGEIRRRHVKKRRCRARMILIERSDAAASACIENYPEKQCDTAGKIYTACAFATLAGRFQIRDQDVMN